MKKLLVLVLFISGCANPRLVQLSPDTYVLSKQDTAGVFGNPAKLKATVIQEANDFAASQGKIAIPLEANETPLIPGSRYAQFEYQFRVADSKDAEAKRPLLTPPPKPVIEKTEKSYVDVKTIDQSEKQKDLYSELLKLDDLRKRGILTDAEFGTLKRKLLAKE
ncbi:MAG: SHOCT domain-containing protein [Pseudomonadota bacterium]